MNKKSFINAVSNKLNISESDAKKVNEIFENNFLIGKNNKILIVKEISEKLNIDSKQANNYYNKAMEILKDGIKDKLKNPFKSQD